MKIIQPCSLEQELLIEEHLLKNARLYVIPEEMPRLQRIVRQLYPGHRIAHGEIDLENVQWVLTLEPVTVTS